MPSVVSLDALHRAVAEFAVTDLDLVIAPPALAAAQQSLDSSGLLLLGEIHGVRENPLLIHALMKAFGLTSLALEWPEDLTPMIRAFLASGALAGHPWLWGRDGRIPPATWPGWPTAGTDLVRRGHRRGLELVPAR